MSDTAQQRVFGRRSLLRSVPALAATAAVAPSVMGHPSSVSAQATPPEDSDQVLRTVTVSGTGIVSVKPDIATLAVGVMERGTSLEQTQDAVSDALAGIMKAITDAGIDDKDVQTSGYNVNPIPKYDDDGNYIGVLGYQVSSDLMFTLRQIESVGSVLDAVVKAGANQVWGVSFSVDDPSKPASEARKAAVTDARTKADELATAAGAVVTGVVTINETSAPAPKAMEYAAPAAADSSGASRSVPVSTGTTDVEVDVQIVFEIAVAAG